MNMYFLDKKISQMRHILFLFSVKKVFSVKKNQTKFFFPCKIIFFCKCIFCKKHKSFFRKKNFFFFNLVLQQLNNHNFHRILKIADIIILSYMASINLLNKVSIIFMLAFSSIFKDFYLKLKKVFIKSSYTTSDLYQHRKNPLRAVSGDF